MKIHGASSLRGITLSSLLASLMLTLPAFNAGAHYEIEENGDFTVTISQDCNVFKNPVDPNATQKYEETVKDVTHSNLNTYLCPIAYTFKGYIFEYNGNNYDFAFSSSDSAVHRFVTTKYYEGKEYYIESIELKWSEHNLKDVKLWLHGRSDKAYPDNLTSKEAYAEDCDVEYFLSPEQANAERVQVVKFTEPIRYIALTRDIKTDNTDTYVRLEYIKLHCTVEPPTASEETIKVSMGDNSTIALPWKNTGMQLEGMVSCSDEAGNIISDPYDLRLRFYLVPQFAWSAKPDPNGEQPKGFSNEEWRLFKAMEAKGDLYDGYGSGETRIECPFDAHGNVITLPAPCSGLYRLEVESDEVALDYEPIELNIWPDVMNAYWLTEENEEGSIVENRYGFALNAVQYEDKGDAYFYYPYQDVSDLTLGAFRKESVVILVPGLYDAQIYYKIEGGHLEEQPETENGLMPAAEVGTDYQPYSEENRFNFLGLTTTSSGAKLQLKIEKNGALTPDVAESGNSESTFYINLSDKIETPTGIAAPAAECCACGAAEYYTISGMKTDGSNLSKGIYIRRQADGTVTKVLITE